MSQYTAGASNDDNEQAVRHVHDVLDSYRDTDPRGQKPNYLQLTLELLEELTEHTHPCHSLCFTHIRLHMQSKEGYGLKPSAPLPAPQPPPASPTPGSPAPTSGA